MTTFDASHLPDLSDTTAVITGANSGVGRALTDALAGAGARVILAVRRPERGEAVAAEVNARAAQRGRSARAEVRQLDLASLASIRDLAAEWREPIDLLINNAGVSLTERRLTLDGFEMQFGTNHLGHFALTNLLLPHIRGRVVTLASQAERMGRLDLEDLNAERGTYRGSRVYGTTKLANLLFTAELQRRLSAAGSTIRAMAAHPGFVLTEMYAEAGPIANALVRLVGQGPERGAWPVLMAALADLPGDSFTGPSHLMHMRGAPELISASKTARDPDLAARLWDVSERMTGIGFPVLNSVGER